MALLHAEVWFKEPFSCGQTISWLCLVGSALLVLHGLYMLKKFGKPKDRLEDTTALVQQGIYHFIRHPMYASLLLLGLGVFFKGPSLVDAALLVGLLAFVTMAGRMEEQENLERFGTSYADYMEVTKMFVPWIY